MAYSVAVSFMHVLEKFELFYDQLSIPYPKREIKSLLRIVKFLISSINDVSRGQNVLDNIEKQVIDAIYEAEDIIESHMSTHLLSSGYENESASGEEIFAGKLRELLHKFVDSMKTKKSNITDRGSREDPERTRPSQPFVLSRFLEAKKKFVGREDEMMKIKDQLIGSSSELKVVAVVGMIGIGKTTLVNEVYNDTLVGNNFDYQAWVSVGPTTSMQQVLRGLVKPDPGQELSTQELENCLQKMLIGRRYLVVLDDMRDNGTWNYIKWFFPDENNQSRIILTTRQRDFALRAAKPSDEYVHQIHFLDEDKSWDLLRYAAIGEQQSCPPQLVKIGKNIARDCQGLPLKIVVLGSLLSRMSPDPETWSKLADDREMQNREMLKVTQDLFHEQLPRHAKACFLYMVAFPQYQKISVSKLFKLWVAEGFLEPNDYHTSEQVAKECLDDLFFKNLVMFHSLSSTGRIKICSIHSAIWPFYDRAAADYKISQSIQSWKDNASPSHRRFSVHKNILFAIKDVYDSIASVSNARSLLCTGPYHPYPLTRVNFSFRLLKVLDAGSIRFYKFPVEILKLVLLRFVALTLGRGELPPSVSNLALLQFLIVRVHSSIKSSGTSCLLPMEIWNMKELRHLQVMGSDLPAPPFDANACLPNLLTLSDVSTLSCTKEVLERTPNLITLGVRVELPWHIEAAPPLHIFDHLAHLHQLKTFKYIVMNPVLIPVLPDSRPVFPSGIKKLTLSGCGFSWESMKEIARLHNLEVLKLQLNAFRGPEWEANEDKFAKLRYLLLQDLDIEHWKADDTNFPKLEHLAIHHCYKLHDIPSGLGEEDILKKIELVDCSSSVVVSAMRIKEKKEGSGNRGPQVTSHSSWTVKT